LTKIGIFTLFTLYPVENLNFQKPKTPDGCYLENQNVYVILATFGTVTHSESLDAEDHLNFKNII